ncbi:MAG: hypothetical protein E7562_01430 [Ruminococcaceae bacterium]|nr:hypothetical protein [Oscillospiraceae bacterium]
MKFIFLDIDGVLNSQKYDLSRGEDDGNIDVTRLPLLKRIVEATNAKIVLSSSWRKAWEKDLSLCDEIGIELNRIFLKFGIQIYDKTPVIGLRKSEIEAYLQNNANVESFVILDDMLLGWGDYGEFLVHTNPMVGRGLEERHINAAIEILNKK